MKPGKSGYSIKVNLVIPMVGQGKRFRAAGYTTYKPFIAIHSKPMIQYVLDAFPKEMPKYIIYSPELLPEEDKEYLSRLPGIRLCPIEAHSEGPAFSIYKAAPQLPLNESFFISYCDIFWTWDYPKVEELLHHDGIVFTRRQFHPHLVENNYSAFCLASEEDPNRFVQIKEKSSFTDNWLSEPLSVGAFYVKSGQKMVEHIERMIGDKKRVSGEFFPSLLFNDLSKEGGSVRLQDVDFFIHWGVPDQLNDYLHWTAVMKSLKTLPKSKTDQNVCCMGGLGARMKKISSQPKALLDVAGQPMYQFVVGQFGCKENEALTTDNLKNELESQGVFSKVTSVGVPTRSQIETLTRAVPHLVKKPSFFLTSCDAFGIFDESQFGKLIDKENPDAVIFTFKPSLLQQKSKGHHTFVTTQNGKVHQVHIKSKSSEEDKGLAGFFWFKKGEVFNELEKVPHDPKHEMCVDHFLKYLVDTEKYVLDFPLAHYVHLGTPNEYEEFQFWWNYRDV